MATLTPAITSVANVANAPPAAWDSPNNAADGSTATATTSLLGPGASSDFLDLALNPAIPATALAVTSLTVTITVAGLAQ